MNNKFDIRSRRQELGLTLEQVADFVGVSKSTVSKWEKGQIKNMLIDKIALLARILKVSPTDITGLAYPEQDNLSDRKKTRTSQGSSPSETRDEVERADTSAEVWADFYGVDLGKVKPPQTVSFDGAPGKLVYSFKSDCGNTHEIIYEKGNVPMVEHLNDEENQLIIDMIELIKKSRRTD